MFVTFKDDAPEETLPHHYFIRFAYRCTKPIGFTAYPPALPPGAQDERATQATPPVAPAAPQPSTTPPVPPADSIPADIAMPDSAHPVEQPHPTNDTPAANTASAEPTAKKARKQTATGEGSALPMKTVADLRAVVLPLMEKVAAMEAEIMQLRSLLASKCNTTD